MENKKKLIGYVTVRKFAGYALPVPVQNKLLRYYCLEKGFKYVLPLCELYLTANYMNLYATLERAPFKGEIGMASVYMLPSDSEKFFNLNSIINEKKIKLHFIFEDKEVSYDNIEGFYLDSQMRYFTANKSKFKIE